MNPHREWMCEFGYFVDQNYRGKGIATKALELVEERAKKMGIWRYELFIHPKNIASIKVAQKQEYKKEGLLKKVAKHKDRYDNACLYSKVISL